MAGNVVRRRVEYRGHVQGVGFRATARDVASELPVSGWVRNVDDGSVELEVQGPAQAVERLLSEVRARLGHRIGVEQGCEVAVVEEEPGFEIRR